jgi:hypothetical protein
LAGLYVPVLFMPDGSLPPDVSALADEADEAWAQQQLRQLQELAEIGMQIARTLPAQAAALAPSDDPAVAGQVALTFSRVARAVRQTLALEARLRRDLKDGLGALRAERKAQADAARAEALAQRRRGLRRAGRQAIADHQPVFEQGGLNDRLDERIEDLCDGEALMDRPFSAVLCEIFDALGVIADWTIWRYEPWALEEVRDRPPGSDFARFHDDMVREGLWRDEDEDEDEDGDEGGDIDRPPDAHPPP